MNEFTNHDRLVAKIQSFSEYLKQAKLEKESLALALDKSDLTFQIRNEILLYQELLTEYFEIFGDILHE